MLEDPEILVAEVRRRREEGSPTRELLQQELSACRRRLGEIPQEQTRLVEGYGKGVVPDGLMRERMGDLRKEAEELRDRVQELEHRWVRLEVSQTQEEAVRAFAEYAYRVVSQSPGYGVGVVAWSTVGDADATMGVGTMMLLMIVGGL